MAPSTAARPPGAHAAALSTATSRPQPSAKTLAQSPQKALFWRCTEKPRAICSRQDSPPAYEGGEHLPQAALTPVN